MVAVINHKKEEHEEETLLLKKMMDNQKHRHGIEKNGLIQQHKSDLTEERATHSETRVNLQEKDEEIRLLKKMRSPILGAHFKKK